MAIFFYITNSHGANLIIKLFFSRCSLRNRCASRVKLQCINVKKKTPILYPIFSFSEKLTIFAQIKPTSS